MPDIFLSAIAGNWRRFIARKKDKRFHKLANKVFARDDHTCQFCGFQAQKYQDVLNLDQDYRNNKFGNLVTACCFCSQCYFLESVGVDGTSGGQMIYLPEISQNQLNSFCHVLFCAMNNGSAYEGTAKNIYRSLRLRCQIIEKQIGAGLSNPAAMGQMIIEYRARFPKKMKKNFLQDARLLPSYTKFHAQLAAWSDAALGGLVLAS